MSAVSPTSESMMSSYASRRSASGRDSSTVIFRCRFTSWWICWNCPDAPSINPNGWLRMLFSRVIFCSPKFRINNPSGSPENDLGQSKFHDNCSRRPTFFSAWSFSKPSEPVVSMKLNTLRPVIYKPQPSCLPVPCVSVSMDPARSPSRSMVQQHLSP
jgi:hypothetical protein